MTATVSDAFGVVADGDAGPVRAVEGAGVRARVRANVPVTLGEHKILAPFTSWARQARTDLREAWWTPASLPTFSTAWAERMPDRERVPGNNSALYTGWLLYNHTVGLAVPLAALLIVGALTPILWLARHPARLLLAAVITTAIYALATN